MTQKPVVAQGVSVLKPVQAAPVAPVVAPPAILASTENAPVFKFRDLDIRSQITDSGEILFCANDVCYALGYLNPRDAVRQHVYLEDVVKRDTLTAGGKQELTYVNESGLFALIFGSKLQTAQDFKHWVTSEVLPSIRRTGSYVSDVDKETLAKFKAFNTIRKACEFVNSSVLFLGMNREFLLQNIFASSMSISGALSDESFERCQQGVKALADMLNNLASYKLATLTMNRTAIEHEIKLVLQDLEKATDIGLIDRKTSAELRRKAEEEGVISYEVADAGKDKDNVSYEFTQELISEDIPF